MSKDSCAAAKSALARLCEWRGLSCCSSAPWRGLERFRLSLIHKYALNLLQGNFRRRRKVL